MNPAFEITTSMATAAPVAVQRPDEARGPGRVALAATCILALTLIGMATQAIDLPVAAASAAATLVGVAAASWRAALQRRTDATCVDRTTGLENRAGMISAGTQVLHQYGAHRTAMIVLDFADLREVHDIYGGAVTRGIVERIVRKLRSVAGWHGVAARTDVAQFTLVLPLDDEKALNRLQRAMGKPARIEFDAGDSEVVLVPDVAIDMPESDGESMQQLWRRLTRDIALMRRNERRRQQYLTRERERHSRPMSISSL